MAIPQRNKRHELRIWPVGRLRSGSDGFTGGVRSCSLGLGDKGATGGNTEGVTEPRLLFAVEGLGGECFVGERPVIAGGRAEA